MDQLTYRSGKWDIINVTLNNNILIYCAAAHRAQAQISIRGSHCQYNDFTVSQSPSHSQQADGPCSLLCIHEVDFMLLKFEILFGIVSIFQSSVIVFQHEKAAWVFLSLSAGFLSISVHFLKIFPSHARPHFSFSKQFYQHGADIVNIQDCFYTSTSLASADSSVCAVIRDIKGISELSQIQLR